MKQKKCKNCGDVFTPSKPLQSVCGYRCGIELAREKKRRKFRRQTREMRERIKTKQELLKEAQAAFNRFIRLRDHAKPCISCGRHHQGQYHAGHYLTVGARPEIRFNEDNCHKQCAPCNNHLSGNLVNYRIGLVEKIGADRVEALEGPHDMPHWTKDEIREIKKHYTRMARELEKSIKEGGQ